VKCAGNYAASLLAQEQAIAAGCDQVVWLDAVEKRYVEEMGGMNLFFVLGSGAEAELVTPELTGTLLPGITRDSLITLARELGHRVTERRFSVDEWRAGVADRHRHRDLRLRHRRGDHPGRRGQGPHGRLHRGRRDAGAADHGPARVAARHPARAGGDTHGWLHRVS
jgi:branched-chain amino acid aminotransferase